MPGHSVQAEPDRSQLELKRNAADDRLNVLRGVLRTFDLHQRKDESSAGLTAQAVYWLLKGQGTISLRTKWCSRSRSCRTPFSAFWRAEEIGTSSLCLLNTQYHGSIYY